MTTTQDAKITLHWLNKSRSQRILWLLEELKVEYDVNIYHRQDNKLAPPELKQVHPLGKSPIVEILKKGEKKPITLAESGFMTEYLIDHYGPQLAPKRYKDGQEGQVGGETESWLRYRYFTHYAEGSFMPYLVMMLLSNGVRTAPVPFFLKFLVNGVADKLESYILPNAHAQLQFIESQLATAPDNGPFLCGSSLTGADILMSFPILASRKRLGVTKEKYPKLAAYADMLEAIDGNKRAVQKIIDLDGSYDGVAL